MPGDVLFKNRPMNSNSDKHHGTRQLLPLKTGRLLESNVTTNFGEKGALRSYSISAPQVRRDR